MGCTLCHKMCVCIDSALIVPLISVAVVQAVRLLDACPRIGDSVIDQGRRVAR
jgi:hypothetical protein